MVFEELISVTMPCQVRNTRNIVRELDLLCDEVFVGVKVDEYNIVNAIIVFNLVYSSYNVKLKAQNNTKTKSYYDGNEASAKLDLQSNHRA